MKKLALKGSLLFFLLMFAMAEAKAVTTYAVSGTLERIAPDHHQATIHNQMIPGYMDEMTMDFSVHNTNELNGVSPGDKITFTLIVSNNESWIQNIKRTGETEPVAKNAMQTASNASPELKTGDRLPDGTMTAENGRQVQFSDFRGRAVAFTFFYTRCPLPDFCPLMNRNFAAARDLISSAPNAPTNWEFLSISFDPESDTPVMLSNYASLFRGQNPNHWLFTAASINTLATLAPALDLMVFREGNSISHNLRTVVLDPRGRIYHEFDGNQWTARELADAVLAATRE